MNKEYRISIDKIIIPCVIASAAAKLVCGNVSMAMHRKAPHKVQPMAIEPEDREDLLADATGLPVRGELSVAGAELIVVGFRNDGAASWFFGADPVFQFDPTYHLRRAFSDGTRYAAAGGKIMRLTRSVKGGRIQFIRESLDDVESAHLLGIWKAHILSVQVAFKERQHRWQDASVERHLMDSKVDQWLNGLLDPVPIAKTSRLQRPGLS